MPHGFGLTGDCVSETADGAWTQGGQPAKYGLLERTRGLPEPWTSVSFSEICYPGLGKGKEGLCIFVGVLKDFGILMKALSHYSSVCITFK